MKTDSFLKYKSLSERDNFERSIFSNNIHRGRILATILIGFGLILTVTDLSALVTRIDNRFQYKNYLIMYLGMILINIIFLMATRKLKNLKNISIRRLRKLEIGLIIYITFLMSWGSIVSLMDQKLYGQLMVFMINMITCSVLYLLDNRKILIPYTVSVLLLIIGLPFFQNSQDILIGHYINLVVFILISWLASRIVYLNFYNDFKSKALLEGSKNLLKKEIEQNIIINNKLTAANLQLKKLALVDELTGLPNRRSFRKYIESAFENIFTESSILSFMMVDIDYFKQFNDTYGHNEGDKIIKAVADQLKSIVGQTMDFAARWGGEEFIYLAFDMDAENIKKAAELLRRKIYELKIPHESSRIHNYISVSIGVSTIKVKRESDVSRGIELADKALYFAKESGRNCVRMLNNEKWS
ncbi:GGDEF domain-containing protein [Desulfitobacterium sp. AusDCA]|uniref:GGDEF domain-containing protein n=1 Tax=Desulfitobacterium sp. AusDCA TaxID=3240383 RepID=UPI003DA722CA